MKKRHLQTFSLLPKLIGLALALSIVSCNCGKKGLTTMTLKAVTSEIKNGQTVTGLEFKPNSLLTWELEVVAGGVAKISDYNSKITTERFKNDNYTDLDLSKSGTALLPLAISLLAVKKLKKGDKQQLGFAVLASEMGASKSMKVQWEIQDKSGKTVAGPVEVRWTVAK